MSFINEIKGLAGASSIGKSLLERPDGAMLFLANSEADRVFLLALKQDGSVDYSRRIKTGESQWISPVYFRGRGNYFLFPQAGRFFDANRLGSLTVVNVEENVLWAKKQCDRNIILHAANFFSTDKLFSSFYLGEYEGNGTGDPKIGVTIMDRATGTPDWSYYYTRSNIPADTVTYFVFDMQESVEQTLITSLKLSYNDEQSSDGLNA